MPGNIPQPSDKEVEDFAAMFGANKSQETPEDTPQETPDGSVASSDSEDPDKKEETPDDGNPDSQDVDPEAARLAIREAKRQHALAKERFHENENLKKENEELRKQLEGKGEPQAPAFDESKINELIDQRFNQMNATQKKEALTKMEEDFYIEKGIKPGTELFKHLTGKVTEKKPQTVEELSETLRLYYRDYTFEKPQLRDTVPSPGGSSKSPSSKMQSAMRYANIFGLKPEDYNK